MFFLNQKGFAPILLILAVLLLMGGVLAGGYYFSSSRSESRPNCLNMKGGCVFSTPNPSPIDEITNWNTYTEPNGYFSFKYPSNLNIKVPNKDAENKYLSQVDIETEMPNMDQPVDTSKYGDMWGLRILVTTNTENLMTKDLRERLLQKSRILREPMTTGPDMKLIESSMKDYKKSEIDGFIYEVPSEAEVVFKITQAKGNKIYEFSYTGVYGERVSDKSKQLIDKILSTFKFLDQSLMVEKPPSWAGSCDLNEDQKCDKDDVDRFIKALGKKRSEVGYDLAADADLDGIVSSEDLNSLNFPFPVTVPKSQ